jgi:hypothetical protein
MSALTGEWRLHGPAGDSTLPQHHGHRVGHRTALAAIAFRIVGRWLIGRDITLIRGGMNGNHLDSTLTKFLGSIVAVALSIDLVLGILGDHGFQTTSLAAMLAGAGPVIAVRHCSHADPCSQLWFDTNDAIERVCTEAGWPAPAARRRSRLVQG